jgi:hypothetical protein
MSARDPDAVTVSHAVPFLHRPEGTRREEYRLLRTETPARLVRVRDRDMEPVHSTRRGESFFVAEGDLWARVRTTLGSRSGHVLRPEEFLAFLGGTGPVPEDEAVMRSLMRTPLSPRDRVAGRAIASEAKRARGGDMGPRGPGLVLHDGRDRGGDDLVAFLRDEIRVAETAVYVRTAPLVRSTFENACLFHVSASRSFEPQLGHVVPMPDEGRAEAFAKAYPRRRPGDDCPSIGVLRKAGLLEPRPGSEARLLANVLPAYVMGSLASWPAVADRIPAALAVDAMRGATGSIGAEDAHAVLVRAQAGLEALACYLDGFMAPGDVRSLATHLGESVLPRISASLPTPEDDAEALGRLVR